MGQPVDRPSELNFVFDDDGGKVQIVPANLASAGDATYHGGKVMSSVKAVSVFLGNAWADPETRGREASLNSGLSSDELQKHNIRTLPPAVPSEDFSDLSQGSVNDLTIQHRLAEMMRTRALPAPSPSTIYVVFLAPGIASTLGGHTAGVEYAAYHNFVTLDSGEVRYVVVPFQESADRHASATARALVEAALNPNGTGWF
jgi:hypothetical protein